MSFFEELKRRNVFRVGVAYVVASWVILQVADLVFEAIKAPDWVLQALMAMVVLGFFAALIIAWAYEVTPEGIKRESEVDRSQSVTPETANKLNHITIGLVILAIVVVAVDRMIPEQGDIGSESVSMQESAQTTAPASEQSTQPDDASPAEKSVAVLPFVNMSSDPEQEFFSDGISEEILNVLVRIPNLKVAARTSSFQFKGQNLDIADIARQLRVNHILEGSVRKAGDQLRITAQLIEADSGYHLWSNTFDRKLEDVFAIQDEIANAIAGELRSRLAGESLAASQQINMEAYELYLKGRSLVATRNLDDLNAGIEILLQAIELEQNYAPAMGTLAKAYMVKPWFTRNEPAGPLRENAREWAKRALAIEPGNPEALAAMAVVLSESDMNPSGALELMRKAVEMNPGSVAANNFLGDLLVRTGDLDSGLYYESRAAELDPLGPIQLTDLANVYFLKKDFEKVEELAQRALRLSPGFDHAERHLDDLMFIRGDIEGLKNELAGREIKPGSMDPGFTSLRMSIYILEQNNEQARALLDEMMQKSRTGEYSAAFAAFDAVALGDFDAAGELLMMALEQNDGTWTYPGFILLPEQAPDSEPWQDFWRQPGPTRFAELRRANGLNPFPSFLERTSGESK